jgi:predicted lysophospholipase L1 biosynthesis ABC-type transport system permease subunit
MAERYWPAGDVVGRTARLGAADGQLVRIVGVVEDAQYGAPTDAPRPYVFLAAAQSRIEGLTIVVHARAGAEALIASVREAVRAVDPALPAYGAITMDRAVRNALTARESAVGVSAVLGILALLLAVIGLYGVVSYTVERRRREVGIRVALGASAHAVQSLIVARAFRMTMVGLAVGLAGALAMGRVMSSLLFEVSPTDATAFGGVAVVLAVVTLIASWIPARRASRVDPMVTLRSE